MKVTLFALLTCLGGSVFCQQPMHPVIKGYGGIYDIPGATVKVDTGQFYKIVIDVVTGADDPDEIAWGLKNVARMINLHAISGLDPSRMHVVLAIHGRAAYAVMNNQAFKKRFDGDNPNIGLIRELEQAGVRLTVCGQSLIGRGIEPGSVLPSVEMATSMLTTVTTYQLKGYAMLKF